MARNSPNLARNVKLQIGGAEQTPNRINTHAQNPHQEALESKSENEEERKNILKGVKKKHLIYGEKQFE